MENSAIEWTTHTMNPWRGCTKVSPGCAHCYAETFSNRNPALLGEWGPSGKRVVAAEAAWREPVRWNKRAAESYAGWEAAVMSCRSEYDEVLPYERPRVFCASLADVFEDWAGPVHGADGGQLFGHYGELFRQSVVGWVQWMSGPIDLRWPATTLDDVRARLFDLIEATPELDWLLLTKRPHNIPRMMPARVPVRANVWLGTSVENQETADERIPILLTSPAAVHFLSVEPLLGPIDLTRNLALGWPVPFCPDSWVKGIGWVIVGGESGPDARPCRIEWVRDIVKQCKAAGVPVFVKQLGAHVLAGNPCDPIDQFAEPVPNFTAGPDPHTARILFKARKGGNPAEWPPDLRLREFPAVEPQRRAA